jgi:uncharacterized protein (DUF2344 family)
MKLIANYQWILLNKYFIYNLLIIDIYYHLNHNIQQLLSENSYRFKAKTKEVDTMTDLISKKKQKYLININTWSRSTDSHGLFDYS